MMMMVVVAEMLLLLTRSRRNRRLSLAPSLELTPFLARMGSRNQHYIFPTLWQD